MQVLYDLLVPNSAELPLREDPVLGAVPSGLTFAKVSSASDILHLLEAGNARRKTERTDANTQSSRSHAVLEVCHCSNNTRIAFYPYPKFQYYVCKTVCASLMWSTLVSTASPGMSL